MARAFTALVFVGLLGCVHRARIVTDVPGAEVRLGGKPVGVTPLEVQAVVRPWRAAEVEVRLPGHRPAEIDLRDDIGPVRLLGELITFRWARWWGGAVRTEHSPVLVRQHGRAGTWTPEEAESGR